jgi:hypothetical protein
VSTFKFVARVIIVTFQVQQFNVRTLFDTIKLVTFDKPDLHRAFVLAKLLLIINDKINIIKVAAGYVQVSNISNRF